MFPEEKTVGGIPEHWAWTIVAVAAFAVSNVAVWLAGG